MLNCLSLGHASVLGYVLQCLGHTWLSGQDIAIRLQIGVSLSHTMRVC